MDFQTACNYVSKYRQFGPQYILVDDRGATTFQTFDPRGAIYFDSVACASPFKKSKRKFLCWMRWAETEKQVLSRKFSKLAKLLVEA